MSGARAALLLAAAVLLPCACDHSPPGAAPTAPKTAPPSWFVERTADSGVDFHHQRGGGGDKHLIEIFGGGVAILDYDGDGALDLYFPQGAPLPKFDPTGVDLRDRLFRATGPWRYVDVTEQAHCSEPSYTCSATAADYDGDGDPDLMLCNLGPNRLLRNDGGRFTDVTAAAGIKGEAWTTCAAFGDFDLDGDLDMYVGNYVVCDLNNPLWCGDKNKGPEYRSYCHPDQYPGERDQFYRNNGDGTFTDITREAGMWDSDGKALGLGICDYDNNGLPDLYVANDSTGNYLWHNEGGLRFRQVALETGCAVSEAGLAQASMGIDWADVDLDGDFDVVVTNMALEPNTLYRNHGDGTFVDHAGESGLGFPSVIWVGFGARFFDVDNDGDEDLYVVNGHVIDNIELYRPGETFMQPSHLYWNDGTGHFKLAGTDAGPFLAERHVARALATFDPDNDGDLDVVTVDNGGQAHLLENMRGQERSWIGFRLRGADQNRDAIGARITLHAGGRTQMREQRGTCSYLSFVDLRILFGLGKAEQVDWVEVRWPRGKMQRLEHLEARRYHEIVEPR
ncbi:MAG: CRTAC1 family protein [Planctomycetota bacterium]